MSPRLIRKIIHKQKLSRIILQIWKIIFMKIKINNFQRKLLKNRNAFRESGESINTILLEIGVLEKE